MQVFCVHANRATRCSRVSQRMMLLLGGDGLGGVVADLDTMTGNCDS